MLGDAHPALALASPWGILFMRRARSGRASRRYPQQMDREPHRTGTQQRPDPPVHRQPPPGRLAQGVRVPPAGTVKCDGLGDAEPHGPDDRGHRPELGPGHLGAALWDTDRRKH